MGDVDGRRRWETSVGDLGGRRWWETSVGDSGGRDRRWEMSVGETVGGRRRWERPSAGDVGGRRRRETSVGDSGGRRRRETPSVGDVGERETSVGDVGGRDRRWETSAGDVGGGETAHLYRVRVAGLAEDLEQRRIGDEEEAREEEALLLEVAGQRLLAQLQLLEQVRQQLTERVVAHTALHHIRVLVRLHHDLHPRLVDVDEPLRLLRQLLRDVAADEHRLEVDPEVLHRHPVLDDLRRPGQLLHPLLDLRLERSVVPGGSGRVILSFEALEQSSVIIDDRLKRDSI